jgi:hypothetical protein
MARRLGERQAAEFRHRAFWAVFEERHPEEKRRRVQKMKYFWQREMSAYSLVVTMFVSPNKDICGIFLGRNEKLGATNVAERLKPYADRIFMAMKVDPRHSTDEFPFVSQWQVNCFSEDNWPAMADWMVTEASRLERAVVGIIDSAALDSHSETTT